MSEKIVLIDGHSILNRAFYGIPDLTNAEGLHTNAIYGFLNIMFRILDEEKPNYLLVAFDRKEPTFRHQIYKAYKGTRKAMPDELREQVPVLKEMLKCMQIQILEQPGLEADDILGSLAKQSENKGMEVALISGDRDLLQIASKHIKIRIPKTKIGKTEIEDYYAEDVKARYQVTPEQFIELKALMGDTADNIPGVPKVGEKTATELMVSYGSIEDIYNHINEITKKAIKESLLENRELADLSKTLATIKTDCILDFSYDKAKADGFYTKEAYELCKKLEFKNILNKFEEADCKTSNTITDVFYIIKTRKEADFLFNEMEQIQECGFSIITNGNRENELLGISFAYYEDKVCFLPVNEEITTIYLTEKLHLLSKKCNLSTFEIKKSYSYLDNDQISQYTDILIAAYLLNPLKNDYEIETIASEHLNMIIPSKNECFGKMLISEALTIMPDKVKEYACYNAYVAYKAAPVLKEKLIQSKMYKLFSEIEMPLSLVLYEMEQAGMLVKPEELREYGKELQKRIDELESIIHEMAGEDFNINSPKQFGEILFEKMHLPGGKKTKTGYSTSADVLEKLAPDYPIVASVLEYRGLVKLKSTYADGLFSCIASDGRIHTSFNQTITATGRISSTEPNLQNIPMRTELGRKIRKVFIPKQGYIYTDADYSQIELRLLAHMSNDAQLIDAYKEKQDIHRMTASKVFHVPFDEVTDLQRRNAKAVNFGIVYGISSFGLSQDLSITKKEASDYIEQYFETYPKIKEYLNDLVESAKQNGYAETMFGRRRPIPELSNHNFMIRSFGERIAMNSPIQGSAADIMKIAMIKVRNELHQRKLKSKLVLQVHDELVIETLLEEQDEVREILEYGMKEAAKLSVELEIDLHTGNDWYDAK